MTKTTATGPRPVFRRPFSTDFLPFMIPCLLLLGAWELPSSATAQTSFPDRTLIKGSGPAVYIVAHNKACWIPNPEIFNSMGLNWNAIQTISDGTLNTIPQAPLLLKGSGPAVYIVANKKICWIPNPEIFNIMGLNWNAIQTVSDQTLNAIPQSSLLLKGSGPKVHLIEGNSKRWITSAEKFNSMGLDWGAILTIVDWQLQNIPEGASVQ